MRRTSHNKPDKDASRSRTYPVQIIYMSGCRNAASGQAVIVEISSSPAFAQASAGLRSRLANEPGLRPRLGGGPGLRPRLGGEPGLRPRLGGEPGLRPRLGGEPGLRLHPSMNHGRTTLSRWTLAATSSKTNASTGNELSTSLR